MNFMLNVLNFLCFRYGVKLPISNKYTVKITISLYKKFSAISWKVGILSITAWLNFKSKTTLTHYVRYVNVIYDHTSHFYVLNQFSVKRTKKQTSKPGIIFHKEKHLSIYFANKGRNKGRFLPFWKTIFFLRNRS